MTRTDVYVFDARPRGARANAVSRLLVACGLAAAVSVIVLLIASVSASSALAATWQTKISGANHVNRTYSVTMNPSHPTRLKYWTARKWDADDDGGEWEYDWVKFRLIRNDTSAVVKTVGPLYSPTGHEVWHTFSITLPSGVRNYTLKVTCDDARWGFKLQQKY